MSSAGGIGGFQPERPTAACEATAFAACALTDAQEQVLLRISRVVNSFESPAAQARVLEALLGGESSYFIGQAGRLIQKDHQEQLDLMAQRLARLREHKRGFVGGLGATGDGDIMSLLLVVMMEITKSEQKDLKDVMRDVRAQNDGLEQNIEYMYAKLRREVSGSRQRLDALIRQIDEKIENQKQVAEKLQRTCKRIASLSPVGFPDRDPVCPAEMRRTTTHLLVKSFVNSLAAGACDEQLFDFLFHPAVVWKARVGRAPHRGVKEGRPAAKEYVQSLARAISEKGVALTVISVEPAGEDFVVRTRWSSPLGNPSEDCANFVKLLNGQVTSVTEAVESSTPA